jgi:SAM-dependent methyltransferase
LKYELLSGLSNGESKMKNYKEIWNNLSTDWTDASAAVATISDEEELRRNGQLSADFLREVLQITPADKVLEIGCGVARIGRQLAPLCGEWHGTDISGNMIAYSRERTQGVPNVYLHELPESNLCIFNDGYFDCVYSSIVFMHLDKAEMFTYMQEAYRVLAPGGRAYFDTLNILSPDSWIKFLHLIEVFSPQERPSHAGQFSTPQEMHKFMEEAGFADIHVDGNDRQLVVALGRKPEQEGWQRPIEAINLGAAQAAAEAAAKARAEAESIVKLGGKVAHLPYNLWLQVNENMVAKNAYIEELETTLATKNLHIAHLEGRIRKQERMMRPLPVRAALRLTRKGSGVSSHRPLAPDP